MLTLESARAQIASLLNEWNRGRSGPETLVILDEQTIERHWGWVFFYASQGWRDGDALYAIAGNAPFMVERSTGAIHITGTGRSIDFYIKNYELTGNPFTRPGSCVEIESCEPLCDVTAAVRLLRKHSALTVADAKQGLDEARQGRRFNVQTQDSLAAETLSGRLRALGFGCRQQPERAD